MSTARKVILQRTRQIHLNTKESFGYETKIKRIKQGLEKSHVNDAFVIADGTTNNRSISYTLEQKKRNSRVLQVSRKGYKPSIRRQRYKIQPKDFFWVNGIRYTAKGMYSYGRYILYGNMKRNEYVKIENIERYFTRNSWQFI
jgi:hypothetical protein